MYHTYLLNFFIRDMIELIHYDKYVKITRHIDRPGIVGLDNYYVISVDDYC